MEQRGVNERNPYAPPGAAGGGAVGGPVIPFDPNRSNNLVKNGIIGAVFLGMMPIVSFILGIGAWSRAKSDLRMMELGRMSTENGARGKTKAGLALGKINTIVAPFALITLILYVWILIETH